MLTSMQRMNKTCGWIKRWNTDGLSRRSFNVGGRNVLHLTGLLRMIRRGGSILNHVAFLDLALDDIRRDKGRFYRAGDANRSDGNSIAEY